MDVYLKHYREMLSLRGLADHTIKSYSTYIRVYLMYLSDILHRSPEEASWEELRDFLRWLKKSRNLSDRTVNHCISQLRFFTMYVLHKPWDPTQLPILSIHFSQALICISYKQTQNLFFNLIILQ